MVRTIFISASLGLALGSLLGYTLQKMESQPIAKQEIIPPSKQISLKPVSKRDELMTKYGLCTESTPDPKTLSRLDDKTLNDLVFQVCTEKS